MASIYQPKMQFQHMHNLLKWKLILLSRTMKLNYKKIPTLIDGIDLSGKDALSRYAELDQMEVYLVNLNHEAHL